MAHLRLLLALLAVLGTALAQESDRSEQLEQDIASYNQLLEERSRQLEAIDAGLQTTTAELRETIARRDQLSQQIGGLQQERESLQAQIASLNEEIAATEARIAELDAQLERLKDRIQALLVNLYRQRGGSRLASVLSEVTSFHELQVANYYLSLLSQQDVSVISELDATLAALASEQERFRQQLAEVSEAEARLAANQNELSAQRQQLEAVIAELESSREGQLANQRTLIEEQQSFEARLEQLSRDLQSELERLARLEAAQAAIAARGQRQSQQSAEVEVPRLEDLPPLTSGYSYPVDNPRLVRGYGEGGLSGVWLQTQQTGAPVRAVQPGVVAEVGPGLANQGYIVILRHAEGLFTAYLNLQAGPPVRLNQQVAQDQIIGYLGGSSFIPPNVLEFHTGWTGEGRPTWTDPAELLGF